MLILVPKPNNLKGIRNTVTSSVVDQHRFDADLNPDPKFHIDADPDPDSDLHQNDAEPHADPTLIFTHNRK
jgi:hypothetical protein